MSHPECHMVVVVQLCTLFHIGFFSFSNMNLGSSLSRLHLITLVLYLFFLLKLFNDYAMWMWIKYAYLYTL